MVKKTRKLLAAVLALTMTLTVISALTVQAYTPWVNDGVVLTTPITDEWGNELTAVTAGAAMTAMCKVKAGADAAEGQKATLILCAYAESGLLCSSGVAVNTVTLTKQTQVLKTTLDVPADAKTVKAFLWDDRINRRPLAEVGVVGGSAVEVTGITVGGVAIEEFDPAVTSYNVNISAGYINYPEIVVHTSDAMAKAEIIPQGEFPAEESSMLIKVSKNGAQTASYTLHLKQEAPAVTNAKYKKWTDTNHKVEGGTYYAEGSSTASISYQEVLPEPYWGGVELYAETTPTYGNFDLGDSSVTGLMCFSDRPRQKLYDLSPELYGGIAVQIPYGDNASRPTFAEAAAVNEEKDALTFDINRTATVYVWGGLSSKTAIAAYEEAGFTACAGSLAASNNANSVVTGAGTMAFKTICDVNTTPVDGVTYDYKYSHSSQKAWYKKEVAVKPNEIVNVGIPASESRYHFCIVKFHDNDTVQNPTITTAEGTEKAELVRSVYNSHRIDGLALTDEGEAPLVKNVFYIPRIFSNREHYGAIGYSDDVLGADAIALPWNMQNSDGDTLQSISFDLTHSAKVYVTVYANSKADVPLLENFGYKRMDAPVFTGLFTSATQTKPADVHSNSVSYVKEYQVAPGDVEHVTIDNLTSDDTINKKRVVVLIKKTALK